jgi:hypothetical protein
VWPHVALSAAHSLSGSVPDVTAAQCPLATPVLVWTQASHVPLQAFEQQTPSVQYPLVHWLVPLQLPPRSFLAVQVCVPVSQ